MKKLILLTLSFIVAATLFTSCAITSSSITYKRSTKEARAYEPSIKAPYARPLAVDIEVISEKRIIDTWTFDITPSKTQKIIRKTGDIPQELKVKALAKSSFKHGADMIIAATFDYEQTTAVTTGVVKSDVVIVTVMGYPAKFKNWKPVSGNAGDYEWISGFYGVRFATDKSSNINVSVNGDKK